MKILYVENHVVFAANVTSQFLSQHSVTVAPSLADARHSAVECSIDLPHQSAHQIIYLIIIGHVRHSIFSKQFRMNTHGEDGVPLPGGFSDVRQ